MRSFSEFKFLSATSSFEECRGVVIGCPLESSTSIPGCSRAPNYIREASWRIESYSPYQRKDLKEIPLCDLGNFLLPPSGASIKKSFSLIEEKIEEVLKFDKKLIILGGDHLVTLPVVRAIKKRETNLRILHLDAHLDERKEWRGEKFTHASVMYRIREEKIPVVHLGIRSLSKEEKDIPFYSLSNPPEMEQGGKYYLSLDMDFFDPSIAPAVSNPEPGGENFSSFLDWLLALPPLEVVGIEIVEVNPLVEGIHITSVLAATVIRELILKFW